MKALLKVSLFTIPVYLMFLMFLMFLVSCASAPPPAPSESKSRAEDLVKGGLDAGQAPAAKPAESPAAQTPAVSAAKAAVQAPQEAAPAVASAVVPAEPASPPPGALTAAESAYLQNYLNRLNYMVYYSEGTGIDPRVAKIAVSQANRYLIEKMGLSVIDYDQIEKNKKDQAAAWQAETGGSISLIQYLAQKFNADVYIELDFSVASDSKDGKFTAAAQGSIKIFETSTATLLGSIAFTSQPAFSPSSLEAAASNAIASSVWTLMPKVTTQAKDLFGNSLARGVRFEVIIQKTPDSKAVSTLRRALAKKIREVEQVSYSPEETRLYLYSFTAKDRIEDAMYEAATQAGLRDLNLVYMRGRSFTFNSGL
ncbi:MAG: DUF6175 family protein [Spirochaetota bacterium]